MTREEAISFLECGAVPNCCCSQNKKHGGDCDGEKGVIEAINMAIEALQRPEIIRCKNCKFYESKQCKWDCTMKSQSHYCSYAERKEENA